MSLISFITGLRLTLFIGDIHKSQKKPVSLHDRIGYGKEADDNAKL